MAIRINQQIKTTVKSANVDAKYGPYQTIDDAKNAIAPLGAPLTVDNGTTFGLIENNIVTEYMLKDITQNTTVSDLRENFSSCIERKVNNTKVVLKKSDGTVMGYFTLNQAANGDIELIIPGDEQVQADWSESDSSVKSYIVNKPKNIVLYKDIG